MLSWIQEHNIELMGAITGLVYLYLEIKQKIWLWPFGILTSGLYIYIFFASKFYADMALQFYYLAISIYGWWHWVKGGGTNAEGSLPVIRLRPTLAVKLTVVTAVLFALMVYVLKEFTDSPLPYGDAFTTALSITATWMLARKILEMWWVWVVVNAVSMALYIYKGLYPTTVLFFFYTTMSFVGYYHWRSTLNGKSD